MKNIFINKDGQQLGPYSIDDAKGLVLSGHISATDWAWTDGAADWIPLNHIPGFSTQTLGTPSAPASSLQSTAAQEQELWRGTPSQLLNLRLYTIWIIILAIAIIAGVIQKEYFIALIVLVPLCILQCVWAILKIRATRYVVTTQRVQVVRGIFSKDVQEIELFRVKDTSVHQTLFLRLFSLGNIRILSGDSSNPSVFLSAIPKPVDLRERLRQEVLNLRQKFGVRELDVM